jgi:hypothetical protein
MYIDLFRVETCTLIDYNCCSSHHEAALYECAQVDAATLQLHLPLHQEEKVVTLQQQPSSGRHTT